MVAKISFLLNLDSEELRTARRDPSPPSAASLLAHQEYSRALDAAMQRWEAALREACDESVATGSVGSGSPLPASPSSSASPYSRAARRSAVLACGKAQLEDARAVTRMLATAAKLGERGGMPAAAIRDAAELISVWAREIKAGSVEIHGRYRGDRGEISSGTAAGNAAEAAVDGSEVEGAAMAASKADGGGGGVGGGGAKAGGSAASGCSSVAINGNQRQSMAIHAAASGCLLVGDLTFVHPITHRMIFEQVAACH